MAREMMQLKTYGLAALCLLVLAFALQNLADTRVQLLLWELRMPLALLVFLIFLLGMLAGWLLHFRAERHATRASQRRT